MTYTSKDGLVINTHIGVNQAAFKTLTLLFKGHKFVTVITPTVKSETTIPD